MQDLFKRMKSYYKIRTTTNVKYDYIFIFTLLLFFNFTPNLENI